MIEDLVLQTFAPASIQLSLEAAANIKADVDQGPASTRKNRLWRIRSCGSRSTHNRLINVENRPQRICPFQQTLCDKIQNNTWLVHP